MCLNSDFFKVQLFGQAKIRFRAENVEICLICCVRNVCPCVTNKSRFLRY